MSRTVALALREAADILDAVSDTPRLDAELLMAHALGVSRSELLLRHIGAPTPETFAPLLERRLTHEPIAYILGEQEFYGLPFRVSPDVLIPRADSEVLVEQGLKARPDARRVLDLGTGSGALLLAVLAHLPHAIGIGIDRSPAALGVARINAERLGLAERAQLLPADWEQPGWDAVLEGPFDLVLANPPYVEDGAELSPSVRAHEPATALFAGSDGLDAYRVLIPQIPRLLSLDGAALVEIGFTQADAVGALAAAAGLLTQVIHDLGRRPRALLVTFPLGKRPDNP